MVTVTGSAGLRRVALSGLESSHADEVIRLLNTEGRLPSTRVAALVDGDGARAAEPARRGRIDTVVADAAQVAGRIDAAIVCERDGGAHAAIAAAFIDQGVPVFVDKPFTTDAADARALVERARDRGVVLMSCSALRFAPEVLRIADELSRDAGPRRVEVFGPVDTRSPYGGVYYYGSHLTDVAVSLVRGAPRDVHVEADGDGGFVASARTDVDELVLHGMPAATGGFALRVGPAAVRPEGEPTPLTLSSDYFWPAIAAFFAAVDTGSPVVSAGEMVRSVELLDDIAARLPAQRTTVRGTH